MMRLRKGAEDQSHKAKHLLSFQDKASAYEAAILLPGIEE